MKKPAQLFVLCALLSATVVAPSAQQAPPAATFKVEVSLVHLLVTVKDGNGAPIAELQREDFTILDDGVQRQIAVFERRTNRPLSVALMMDASLSTAKELEFEQESAKQFIWNLLSPGSHPRDRVAVLKFSSYVDLLANFTRSERRLTKALEAVRPESGTSIYDAIVLACEQLQRRPGRRVMTIITDGGDTTSRISFQEALEAAHSIDAVIYGIIVVPIKSDAGRNTGGENALKTLAANTGGATFVQFGSKDLDQAFDEILQNLRTQYLIAYYPPPASSDGERFRRVTVTVNRPGATVLVRNGYYVPEMPRASSWGKPSLVPRNRPPQEAEKEPGGRQAGRRTDDKREPEQQPNGGAGR